MRGLQTAPGARPVPHGPAPPTMIDHERLPILFLINDLAVGGAQRVVVSQACGLDRDRFAPEVASLEIVPCGALAAELAQGGVPLRRLRSPGEPLPLAWPRLMALLEERRPILHTHLAAAAVAGTVAARLAGAAAIFTTVHNLRDWQEGSRHPLRWMARRALERCDRVIAVSEAVRDALLRHAPRLAARTVVVRNGVDLGRVAGARAHRLATRGTLRIPADGFVVGAVARLDRSKGLDVLVEAAGAALPRIPALRVLIVGDGPERAALEALARARGLASIVRFAGEQPAVAAALGALDLFVAPSRTEGLGLAILEALGAGIPVLGARVGGIPEVIEHGGCGELVDGHDPAEWADRIVRLAADRAALRAMGEGGPARAARFSMHEAIHALEALYTEASAERSAGRRAA